MPASRTLTSTVVATLVAVVAMAMLRPSWLVALEEPDTFEAVSLRRVPDPCGGIQLTTSCQYVSVPRSSFTLLPGGRVEAAGVSPVMLIVTAYLDGELNANRVIGAPGWAISDRYDLIALTGRDGVQTEDENTLKRGVASMLRTLLTDRFKLRVHTEPRKASVSALRRTNGATLGPMLHPAARACTLPPQLKVIDLVQGTLDCATLSNNTLEVRGLTMSDVARVLGQISKLTVRDETGLQDRYDFVLQTPERGPGSILMLPTGKLRMPSLSAEDLGSQLGLALVRTTAPVDHLIIDAIKKPAED